MLISRQSHYSCLTVAAWLGIGDENVIAVPSHADNSIDLEALEAAARQQLKAGRKIAAIVATLGTTDAFGLDDLAAAQRGALERLHRAPEPLLLLDPADRQRREEARDVEDLEGHSSRE
jgi:glutamate/tyrosine decarboxylase-like PLP-dependent enzyme